MHKLGVIVPYRNRPNQLATFTNHIKKFLNIPYELIIVEQAKGKDFNRGALLNIGFQKAERLNCDYIAFHDIDMLPINSDYSYSEYPVHLITELDLPESVNRTLFEGYFGGVTIFPSNVFRAVNGYSNGYYGWGFEDDDLLLRCIENGINIRSKRYKQFTRSSVALEFNGKDSYVAIPNTVKSFRDCTIFVSFRYDEINRIKENITDNNSVFSIPGFDTSLSINSFFDIMFQFWKKDLSSISIHNKVTPYGHINAAVTFSNKGSIPEAAVYLNGELVGKNKYDKLIPLQKQKYIFLGVGDPDREEKNNWFKGQIDRFAVFNKKLSVEECKELTSSSPISLFDLEFSDYLNGYYEMLNVHGNTLLDLMEKNNGYVYNCKQTYIDKTAGIDVFVPHRREGKFKVLPHEEHGYKDGYWVNWASRENQLKYLDKFYSKRSNYINDGLTTLKYKINREKNTDGYHHLKVTI